MKEQGGVPSYQPIHFFVIYIKGTNVMQLGSMFICNCNIALHVPEAKSVRNMYSNIAVTNKHNAKLHHVGSLYIYNLTMHGNPNLKYIFLYLRPSFSRLFLTWAFN